MFNSNFASNPFGKPSNNSLEDLQRNYQQQLQQIQAVQQAQSQARPDGILLELNNALSGLTTEEQDMLAVDPNYINAKSIYEASFMSFLGNKYAIEFSNGEGRASVENLIRTVKDCKQNIQANLKEQRDKIAVLSKLMESDPEIQKKMNEILNK